MKRIVQNQAPIDPAAWNQRENIICLYREGKLTSSEIAKGLDLRLVDVLRVLRAGKGKGD